MIDRLRKWLKMIIGLLLILSVIYAGLLLIDLLAPYPYIALPVSIVGIIVGCDLLFGGQLQLLI